MTIPKNAQNVQTSLSLWASELSSPLYDPNWNTEVSQNGVDPSRGRVHIQLNWLAVCEKLAYKLFNGRNILLRDGIMTKGALTIKLGSEESLQGWNGPLKFRVNFYQHPAEMFMKTTKVFSFCLFLYALCNPTILPYCLCIVKHDQIDLV